MNNDLPGGKQVPAFERQQPFAVNLLSDAKSKTCLYDAVAVVLAFHVRCARRACSLAPLRPDGLSPTTGRQQTLEITNRRTLF